MGARPSSFKKGGGFLNNVDGEFTDYSFLTEFPGQEGKAKKSDFNPLYFHFTAQVDGNEEPQSTTILAGSSDDFEISDDGKTLTPVDPKIALRQGTPFDKLISSLVAKGFPETNLPDDDEPINYESILGWRVRFVQERDEKGMEKAARDYRKSGGKFNEKGQKKGKDGKYYDLTNVVIAEVYGESGNEAPAPKAAAVKGKTAAAAKPVAGKAKKDDAAGALNTLAKETLVAILDDNEGSIAKSKLPAKIAQKLGVKHPQREEVRKLIYSDEFLTTEDGWTYDQSGKQQLITKTE